MAIKEVKINPDSVKTLAAEIGQTRVGKAMPGGVKPEDARQLTLEELLGDQIGQEVYAKASRIVTSWVKELVADLIAVRALGPAFVFALVELSTAMGALERYGESHPATKLRLKYLLAELEEMRFLADANVSDIVGKLKTWKEEVDWTKLMPDEPHQRIAFEAIVGNFAAIRDAVLAAANLYTYRVDVFNRDVLAIADDFLSQGIPPIERWVAEAGKRVAFNLVSIINAAWVMYLTRMDVFFELTGGTSPATRADSLWNFNEIVLKAVESSEIVQRWRQA
jgi:hypothetical protein